MGRERTYGGFGQRDSKHRAIKLLPPELLSNARRRGRGFLPRVVPVEVSQRNVAPQGHSNVESERLCANANTRVRDQTENAMGLGD
jgi:hypothetical protein